MSRTAAGLLLLGALLSGSAGCATLAAGPPAHSSTPLASRLDPILADPALGHAHWGVLVRSIDSGEVLYARDAERLFVPASNMKLVTATVALETLSPAYRYETTIAAGGPVRNGVVEGPLIITGTGDPSWSDHFHSDSRAVLRSWADSLRAQGISRISGGIVGVDTAFVDPHLGAGWAWDDLAFGYSAEFGALQFNDNVVELELFPSANILDPAIVVLNPPNQYVRIINDTRTMPPGSITAIRIERDEGGPGILIRGEIAADEGSLTRSVAIRDPALFLSAIFREILREQGIAVEGPAIHYSAISLLDPAIRQAVPLFVYRSPPLGEILAVMMKESQNQIAETLLRSAAREARGVGSSEAGALLTDSILRAWEFDAAGLTFRMADGSGLSRYDLVSPALLVQLLEHMDRSADRDEWIASFPIAGRDGTLQGRMRAPPLLDNVRAKTGTLGGIRALSGYLTSASGERIAFSILVNDFLVPGSEVDRIIEEVLTRIALEG